MLLTGSRRTRSGFFNKATEDSMFSNVIDLLFNCACFIYIGMVIPFDDWSDAATSVSTAGSPVARPSGHSPTVHSGTDHRMEALFARHRHPLAATPAVHARRLPMDPGHQDVQGSRVHRLVRSHGCRSRLYRHVGQDQVARAARGWTDRTGRDLERDDSADRVFPGPRFGAMS